MRQVKENFLDAYRECGTILHAAKAVGVDRMTIYRWKEHDLEFDAKFHQAELDVTEMLEREAIRRATQGDYRLKFDKRGDPLIDPETGEYYRELERSDTLLIFLLKAHDPAKYRDNSRVELTGRDGGPIEVDADPYRAIESRVASLAARVRVAELPGVSEPG